VTAFENLIDGKTQPAQIYVLSMSGGEPTQITELSRGAGDPHWAPDGKRIAFFSDMSPEDIAKEKKKDQTTKSPAATSSTGGDSTDADRATDDKYLTSVVYRQNEQGYVDPLKPAYPAIKTAAHSPTVVTHALGAIIYYSPISIVPVMLVYRPYASGA